jgi:anti-sigma factor RsiW
MNVTDDVLNDLLTLYLAGEASADTRALIEERARSEPAFTAKLTAARELDRTAAAAIELPGVPGAPPRDVELRDLLRTRYAIFARTLLLSWAVIFTFVPVLLLAPSRMHPSSVRSLWYLAAIGWLGCWYTHRQVRKARL